MKSETVAVQPSENILGTEKIGRLLAKFAIPGIVAMVINALYNIVDQIFIGQGVGYLGNGATNVIFPLSSIVLAFSAMLGDGTASFMSLKLGEKQEKEAAKGAAVGMVSVVLVGVILCAVYLIFLEPLCRLFGATDTILPYAMTYGRIISIGVPVCAISMGFSSMIRADGSPKYNMCGLLAGCVINVVCDPIFIFVFHWGVAGAALATILGQTANAIINLLYIRRFKSVKLYRGIMKGSWKILPRLCQLGISSFITQVILVVVMAVQNNVLVVYGAQSQYGADIPIAALGITMKIFNIMTAIAIGLASGAQPILGYNYGNKQFDRVKKTFFMVMVIALLVMAAAEICFQAAPMAIIGIFGNESAEYNEFAVMCLQIFLALMPMGCVQVVSSIFFQALGRPLQSSILSLAKQLVFQIPLVVILPKYMGIVGVLHSGWISDLLVCILSVIMLCASWKHLFPTGNKIAPRQELEFE